MEENNPVSEQETTEQVNQEAPEETVGDLMKGAGGKAVKFWLIIISALVYLAGIVYAEVHGLTMLTKGVAPDMRIWAQLGMIAAGVSAVIIPLALKFWTIEAKQRMFTYAFYALDFAFLAFNAFTDFNTQQGQTLVPWAQTYVTYILPASPVIVALLWALVWELDPDVREKIMLLTLRSAMKQKMAQKVADAAKGAKVTDVVNQAAAREVDRALTELFGRPVAGYVMDTNTPAPRGLLQSFFGSLWQLGRRAYSSVMPSQDQDSNSEEPKG